jgi:hypothetical protein
LSQISSVDDVHRIASGSHGIAVDDLAIGTATCGGLQSASPTCDPPPGGAIGSVSRDHFATTVFGVIYCAAIGGDSLSGIGIARNQKRNVVVVVVAVVVGIRNGIASCQHVAPSSCARLIGGDFVDCVQMMTTSCGSACSSHYK